MTTSKTRITIPKEYHLVSELESELPRMIFGLISKSDAEDALKELKKILRPRKITKGKKVLLSSAKKAVMSLRLIPVRVMPTNKQDFFDSGAIPNLILGQLVPDLGLGIILDARKIHFVTKWYQNKCEQPTEIPCFSVK